MTKPQQVELLARGVLVIRGQLLLCHTRGARNTYLPGGHIEPGEPARAALQREILEELGLNVRVGPLLGAVEHTYRQKGQRHWEVNLVFRMTARGLSTPTPPRSLEDYIEFLWLPLSGLASSNLEPRPLCTLIPLWLDARGRRWDSTYPGAS